MTAHVLSTEDLAVDRELANIAEGFRFLLDLTPIDLVEARERFLSTGRPPRFEYRQVEDDLDVARKRLADVCAEGVEDAALASMLMAKKQELQLQLEMLSCRGSNAFLGLSIELYGSVRPSLLREAELILELVPTPSPDQGPSLDAHAFVAAANAELDRYRTTLPDMESHVEIRSGSTGVMVSNGDVLVAPTTRVARSRVDALLHHEIGTHVLTYVNGSHQPVRVLASGLAGHDETQEGLAVFAEYLVGGLSAMRLRQLAARVIAVHDMVEGSEFPDVHKKLVESGVTENAAFTITMRVFRSGGLTKDAVYLRGLRELVTHLATDKDMTMLFAGKMPLTALPLVQELHETGALVDPVLLPRYLDDPNARTRLHRINRDTSLTSLIGDST